MSSRAKRLASSTMTVLTPVALNSIQQGGEARPALDGISSRYSRVIELAHQYEPGTFGKTFDGGPLPLVAVFIGPDVGCGGGSYVGDCGQFCLHYHRHAPGDVRNS